jgi:hypothetical protein
MGNKGSKKLMRILTCFVAASIFVGLQAEDTQMSPKPPVAPKKNVCAPYFLDCHDITGEAYGELLFLQPNGSSLYYAAQAIPLDQSLSSFQAVSPNWKIFELSPGYTPTFKFGGKALFTPTRTKLEVSWEHLETSTKSSECLSTTADGGTLMIGPLFDIGPNSAAYTRAKGKAHFEFDAVDVLFEQGFCAFTRLYPTIFAGVGFARIKQTLQSTFLNAANTTSRSIETYSKFTGAGPKIGVDFDYRIVSDFFFSGTMSCGLAIGQQTNGTTFESDSPFLIANNIPEPNKQTTTVPHRTQLIPSFEERLGFSYVRTCDCWKVKCEVGYLAQIYLNAVQTIDMTAPQVPPSILPGTVPDAGVYAVGFERTLSNFMVTGPFISLAFDF